MHAPRNFAALIAALLLSSTAQAADTLITIKDHHFSPENITIPAGQKVKLTIKNMDATMAEFESYELHREKVVTPNSEITVVVGPLDAGTYHYVDDFHRDTTKGTITVQ